MSKILSAKQKRNLDTIQEKEIKNRFYSRNIDAMRFCNSKGLTVYASAQASNTTYVKIFVQKGVPFRPLNNILYDQSDPKDVMRYTAAIDAEYERLYLKMKDKV
jgi:hypothetical protein